MSDLNKLIKRRATIKALLTRLKSHINDTRDQILITEADVKQLELRLQSADLLSIFSEIQFEIELISDEDESIHLTERKLFEDIYFQACTAGKMIISNFYSNTENRNETQATRSLVNDNGSSSNSNVRLPKMNLPIFTGAYEDWNEYYDMFNSLIHTNDSITDIERFFYLRGSLKLEAAEVIQSLPISAANYPIAFQLLIDRYDNKRIIVHNHISALFSLPQLTRESHQQLRQLLDSALKHLRSLKALKQPVEHWDTILIFIISSKLDSTTQRGWESYPISNGFPTLHDMETFLKNRCDLLEKLNNTNQIGKTNNSHSDKLIKQSHQGNRPHSNYSKAHDKQHFESRSKYHNTFLSTENFCFLCKSNHLISSCEQFLKLSIDKRISEARKLFLCLNCLRKGHYSSDCRSSTCKKCNKKHNTLLHIEFQNATRNNTNFNSNNVHADEQTTVHLSNQSSSFENQILLSTACVEILDKIGNIHHCTALLDSGAQSNFITSELCQALGLEVMSIDMSVVGINQIASKINHKAKVTFKSRLNSFKSALSCLVVPQITGKLPTFPCNVSNLNIPQNIQLADPNFHLPKKIDLLIGASLFWNLVSMGQHKLGNHKPVLQKTCLGWIVSGPIPSLYYNNTQSTHCVFDADAQINKQLVEFWELEEPPKKVMFTQEETLCESHFSNTVSQNHDGRFIVSIPFKEPITKLGDSEQAAINRFYSLERRLQSNAELKLNYCKFMQEYEHLGHMTPIDRNKDKCDTNFYLPHHGVMKEQSLTTKLRVVFDGSAKTTSGWSLNDLQMVGPTIQSDLLSIVMRFRKHSYVVSADITKMYRQILIKPEQSSLQRIVWRASPIQPLIHYELNTITYGTASASYLATKSLQEIAKQHLDSYPVSANIIINDFYIDDLLTGADTIEQAAIICKQVTNILLNGCFELRKWTSNEAAVLKDIKNANLIKALEIGSSDMSKTLGLCWFAESDTLKYSIKHINISNIVTKRTILSAIAQIFDPLGLVGPCIITAKIILQKLWQFKLTWDESVPLSLHTQWIMFRNQLQYLNQIQVPRHVLCNNATHIELHGFSDASESAYGACIYLRSINTSGSVTIRLLCAKSRVAPLKTVTIPRLELCGALILAQLANKVSSSMNMNFDKQFLWSDSNIALSWIHTEPSVLKTFVANRVAEIRDLSKYAQWRHVGTKSNPADLLSRGINPSDLLHNDLWFQGPLWLMENQDSWPATKINYDKGNMLEAKQQCTLTVQNIINFDLFKKYSCFVKLRNVTAYCLRFKNSALISKELRLTGVLTLDELSKATNCLIKLAQAQAFPHEIHDLKNNKPVNNKSRLLSLHPFIDIEGIIRVGGRLQLSEFAYGKIHPIVLPNNHTFTTLILKFEHIRLLHAGPQALLSAVRDQYWPINGRNQVKGIVRACIKCFRVNPVASKHIMGDLPAARLAQSFPFQNVGVDYAGPFSIKDRKGRGSKIFKAYVCVFICFFTKAIHLELVSDLTTDAFIATLRRFVSRRGKPSNIYSDNGTNFVGAYSELANLGKFLEDKTNQYQLTRSLTDDGIRWHFIPPRSPHFGGLWEAGVKSFKYHLRRVVGLSIFTFIDFYTILTQIEATLNSRPLSPLSSDPSDLNPLTPAHFLIGKPLISVPDPNLQHISENRLSSYQAMQRLVQHFWSRWSREYVSELQQRFKWNRDHQQHLQPDTMVVVKEDNMHPMKWQLGRITQLHPGKDGITRVVSIRTANNVIKRAITKICALPIDS